MQFYKDPWTQNQQLQDHTVTTLDHTVSALGGAYDFTERLLFNKLWQGEDRETS